MYIIDFQCSIVCNVGNVNYSFDINIALKNNTYTLYTDASDCQCRGEQKCRWKRAMSAIRYVHVSDVMESLWNYCIIFMELLYRN